MAAGVAAGAGSILLAVCAKRFDDPGGLLQTPAPYAAALVGLLGLLLTQAAFQTGAIAAPLAALAVSEPIVAVVLAVTVLHERLPGSLAARAAGSSGALIAAAGVLTLASARRDAAARAAVAG
jgi:xanthosine utilization system XapX-like protein